MNFRNIKIFIVYSVKIESVLKLSIILVNKKGLVLQTALFTPG